MCSLPSLSIATLQNYNLLVKQCFTPLVNQVRSKGGKLNTPRLRHPIWFVRKERAKIGEELTSENASFVKEMVHARFGPPVIMGGVSTLAQPKSVLKTQPMARGEWSPGIRRTGLVTRKIGIYPMWLRDGTRILTTLLQVVDNHVVKYIPPEEYDPPRKPHRKLKNEGKYGCLLVGAESADPQMFTKEYCGLFKDSGLAPKKILSRFLVSPQAAIQPGTPLVANHFRVGDIVDVHGFTLYRGFQGVMKRWGFKGQPASHGATKTHRRPGNIGGGGEKGRVWPGTKMPGHMGNRPVTQRGLKIWRINTKFNVLYVQGPAVAGDTNAVCYIHDTLLPLKWLKESPPFPTYYSETDSEGELPEDIYDPKIHPFHEPPITFAAAQPASTKK